MVSYLSVQVSEWLIGGVTWWSSTRVFFQEWLVDVARARAWLLAIDFRLLKSIFLNIIYIAHKT